MSSESIIIVKKANSTVGLFMRIMGFKYFAVPPNIIYTVDKVTSIPTQYVNHEYMHLLQYEKDGILKYMFKWWYEFFTKGYSNIEYEKEAVSVENEPSFFKGHVLIEIKN